MLSNVLKPAHCTGCCISCNIAQARGVEINLYHTINAVSATQWHKIVPANHFFMSHGYLRALELADAHRPDKAMRYALFFKNNKLVGAAAFQLIDICGSQNLRIPLAIGTVDEPLGWQQKIKNRAAQYVNNLHFRMLVVGNTYLTGEHGFVYSPQLMTPKEAFGSLDQAIAQICAAEAAQQRPVQAVLVKDFEPQNLDKAQHLQCCGFKKVAAQPNMILYRADRWATFDDYLQAQSGKYRARAKGVIKKAQSLEKRYLTSSEVVAQSDRLHHLYNQVAARSEVNMAHTTPDYFATLQTQLPQHFSVLAYYLAGEMVGFISFFTYDKHTEAHFTGYDYELNRNYAIYNNILYDVVRHGITHQSHEIHFGRTATEIKTTVGAEAVWQDSFMRHSNRWLNPWLGLLTNTLRTNDGIPRHPFKSDEPTAATTAPADQAAVAVHDNYAPAV